MVTALVTVQQHRIAIKHLDRAGYLRVGTLIDFDTTLNCIGNSYGDLYKKGDKEFWLNANTINNLPEDTANGSL